MGAEDPFHHSAALPRKAQAVKEKATCSQHVVSVQPTAHPRVPWEPSQTLGISTHLSLSDANQWATLTLSKLTMGQK